MIPIKSIKNNYPNPLQRIESRQVQCPITMKHEPCLFNLLLKINYLYSGHREGRTKNSCIPGNFGAFPPALDHVRAAAVVAEFTAFKVHHLLCQPQTPRHRRQPDKPRHHQTPRIRAVGIDVLDGPRGGILFPVVVLHHSFANTLSRYCAWSERTLRLGCDSN